MAALVGIVALVLVGGMVWLVLQNDGGGGPEGGTSDETGTSDVTEETTEDATDPSPQPSENQTADDQESPGHGCIDPALCDR
ncbi:hypothetical protein GCM10029992_06000 [Glycomyces albus]